MFTIDIWNVGEILLVNEQWIQFAHKNEMNSLYEYENLPHPQ